MQDATKRLLGATGESGKESQSFNDDPTVFLVGLAVRRKSDNTLSLSSADGQLIGVSLGKDLSDAKRTVVCRTGLRVPMRVTDAFAVGTVTITNVANLLTTTADTIKVGAITFTAQSGAATPGAATFQAVTDVTTTAASLALQINSHATLAPLVHATSALGVVTITALTKGAAGDLALVYTDNGGGNVGATVSGATMAGGKRANDYAALGAAVKVNNTTGAVDSSGTTTGAVYRSLELQGIDAFDGSLITIVEIDMAGGL